MHSQTSTVESLASLSHNELNDVSQRSSCYLVYHTSVPFSGTRLTPGEVQRSGMCCVVNAHGTYQYVYINIIIIKDMWYFSRYWPNATRGPYYKYGLTLTPLCNYTHYKCGMQSLIHSKFQRCSCWDFGMNRHSNRTFYWPSDYLSKLGLNSIRFSERDTNYVCLYMETLLGSHFLTVKT